MKAILRHIYLRRTAILCPEGHVSSLNKSNPTKRQVSEIDLSQPRHETAFWWRHNGPVQSQLTDPINWSNYENTIEHDIVDKKLLFQNKDNLHLLQTSTPITTILSWKFLWDINSFPHVTELMNNTT